MSADFRAAIVYLAFFRDAECKDQVTPTAGTIKVTGAPMNESYLAATAVIACDTTGLASSLPDGKYNTLFMLGLGGLCNQGQYFFHDAISSSVGEISGEQSNQIMLKLVHSGSNATGDVYVQIRYTSENVNFGYGVLFPQFK